MSKLITRSSSIRAMQHFDFNDPSAHSYEQAIMTIRELDLGMPAVEEQFRGAIFNVIARNQDDHVKNVSFLMDRSGQWTLSPAYGLNYACNPGNPRTRDHQMSLAGRRNGFDREDLLRFAASAGLKRSKALGILEEASTSIRDWAKHAEAAEVAPGDAGRIQRAFRSSLMSG